MLIVDDRPASYERVAAMLTKEQEVEVETDPNHALFRAADGNFDLLIVSLTLRISTRCGCAASCARSSARGIFPFW